MFFILSKLLAFLLRPVNWIFFLLLGSLFFKKEKRKKRLLISAVTLFFFFSNAFIFNLVIRWWEKETPEVFYQTDNYDVAVLLGGYSDMNVKAKGDLHHLSGSGNRFHHALQLYQTGKFKKWLLSGGSGRLLDQEEKEAGLVHELLIRLGVDEKDILVEDQSRNTRENALFSKKILEQQNLGNNYLLITSAWHMPRARACFEKVGLQVTPYCTDYKGKKIEFRPEPILLPNAGTLNDWDFLIKEWVGYLVYWMKAYL